MSAQCDRWYTQPATRCIHALGHAGQCEFLVVTSQPAAHATRIYVRPEYDESRIKALEEREK